MATKKLSEALAELQAAANVSGLDVRLVVAGQTDTDNAQTITLQQLLTALNVPIVQTSANGTTKNYIYSASSDEMHTALSGKIWTYTHTDRNCSSDLSTGAQPTTPNKPIIAKYCYAIW